MAWPTDNLSTEHLDSGTDNPSLARVILKALIDRYNTIKSARGTADGICELDESGKVPSARIGRGTVNGVASLNANSKVPAAQLPDAAVSTKGIIEIASDTKVQGGADSLSAVSPSGLAALGYIHTVTMQRVVSGSGNAVSDVALSVSEQSGTLVITLTVTRDQFAVPSPSPPPPSPPPVGGGDGHN